MSRKSQPQITARKSLNRLNCLLARINLRLDTLTATRQKRARLMAADKRGAFSRPVFPLPPGFSPNAPAEIMNQLSKHGSRFESFSRASANDVGYQYDNGYFKSPDAEVLYTIVQQLRPKRILELGCGNSTQIIRQALMDGRIACHHVCVDPHPRTEISLLADEIIPEPVELQNAANLAGSLQPDDVLFIDTSHKLEPANDVTFIYGTLLPQISAGVFIHIHDVFLPYEYPLSWVLDGNDWAEQYLVQAMLVWGNDWDVIWPGYYLQRTLPDFATYFPHLKDGYAQSLWLRRKVR
jgi:hypothetical protein